MNLRILRSPKHRSHRNLRFSHGHLVNLPMLLLPPKLQLAGSKMMQTSAFAHGGRSSRQAPRSATEARTTRAEVVLRRSRIARPCAFVARLPRPVSNSGRFSSSRRGLLAIICCHDIASKRPRSDSQRAGCSSLMHLGYGTCCFAPAASSDASPEAERLNPKAANPAVIGSR